MADGRTHIGQILKELGYVGEFEIQQALREQKTKGGAIGQIFLQRGVITEQQLQEGLVKQSGLEKVSLDAVDIPPEVIDMVDGNVAEMYKIIPIAFESGTLTVALDDPSNIQTLGDLRFMIPNVANIRGVVATKDAIKRAFDHYYEGRTESLESVLSGLGVDKDDFVVKDTRQDLPDAAQLEKDANATPVVKLLNYVLIQAIKDRASDIHLEPFEKEFKVRYRVDGVLYEMMPPPIQLARALISRVKVMSRLDIAETRLPQDGRIELNIAGNPVDLRISTLPTQFGESVVMRVLDRSQVSLNLEQLGLRTEELQAIRDLIALPHGIILVTGPTGSGKTTTLYSALQEANKIDVKVITTEDPVEYDIDGIVQVPINDEIGVTFARCLRSILRQDPDVILVGEIRDLETAQIAAEASLTGHVVFTTVHTNDAPTAVTRLVDLGLEPYLMTATLESIVAQRLVRRICLNCRTEYDPSDEELYELELTRSEIAGHHFYYGQGCKVCNNTGYKGRIGIFEIMRISDRLRNMIMENASTSELRRVAREEGMRTLRESGLLHIYDGITTIEEVVKETVLTQ